MLRSMTAFARETAIVPEGELTFEVRTVNHRFLETSVRLPEDLRGLETAVRERIGKKLGRGKVDCNLRFAAVPGSAATPRINRRYLEQLLAVGQEVGTVIGRPADPTPFELLRWPGVLEEPARDLAAVEQAALRLLDQALAGLVATREREGARLHKLIVERCERIDQSIAQVRRRMPEVLASVRRRLTDRLGEMRQELDPSRLEQELVLLAQRLDVDEEMDRLAAHLSEVRAVLDQAEPVGRRLDFLMQELNREANTLGSKSTDVELTRQAVDMKVLIEQMREQVQNIE